MPSKIQVDQIAGATGSTVTLPSGQTLDLSSGTVTLPSAGITADKLNLISTASVPSVTAKGTPSVTDGYIQLNCEQNSHGIKIKSPPHSAGANYTMVMPSAIGTSNQVLRMNSGATALEFGTVASGSNSPSFHARLNGQQNITASVNTKVTLSVEEYDTNNNFDSTTNYRFTPTTAGTYYVYANIYMDWNSNWGQNSSTMIYKNGSVIARSQVIDGSTGVYGNLFVATTVAMNGTSDYLELFGVSNAVGPAFNGGSVGNTFFGAFKLI